MSDIVLKRIDRSKRTLSTTYLNSIKQRIIDLITLKPIRDLNKMNFDFELDRDELQDLYEELYP